MQVKLISYTPDALNLLLKTKNTRLSYEDDPAGWTEEKKAEHLSYMLQSIKSSWEFVQYVWQIEGVTRAFTHELVRTRQASYAQQSMRVVDARTAEVLLPDSLIDEPYRMALWEEAQSTSKKNYGKLIDNGVPVQDARGLLPTNILTNIMVQWNLRTLHETAKVRLCTRAAKEYQDVIREMRAAVVAVHPWADPFVQVACAADGACAFPRYGKAECPIYFPALDNTAARTEARARFWSLPRYAAAPMAKEGKAQ